MRKAILLLTVFTTGILGRASLSSACECPVKSGIQEEYSRAEIVIEGKVLEASPDKIDVLVKEVFKGEVTQPVVSFVMKSKCSLPLVLNENYLIYAEKDGESFHASRCSRSSLISQLPQDVIFSNQTFRDERQALIFLKQTLKWGTR